MKLTNEQWERVKYLVPDQRILRRVVEALAMDLVGRGSVDLSECFVGGSFCMAKKGSLLRAKLGRGKAPGSWQPLNAAGPVLSLLSEPAPAHEVGLVGT